jgi:hypothetical protein
MVDGRSAARRVWGARSEAARVPRGVGPGMGIGAGRRVPALPSHRSTSEPFPPFCVCLSTRPAPHPHHPVGRLLAFFSSAPTASSRLDYSSIVESSARRVDLCLPFPLTFPATIFLPVVIARHHGFEIHPLALPEQQHGSQWQSPA